MKLTPMAAGVLAAALTLASAASAAGPLPTPPPAGGPASTEIFEAMLAIARAATSNPGAAQNATFSYDAAIQQYNAHDFERARMSALTAISQTAAVPLPQPSIIAPAIPQPSYVPMRLVNNAGQADAEGYVALARRALMTCGAPSASPAPATQAQYAAAVNAILAMKYGAAKSGSQAVVDQCGQASQAYAAQQAALPQPSATPIPMASYSPVPLATLGPDPALLQTPAAMPTDTPTPTPRRGFRL
jgi:hypothetical protein